MKMMMITIGLKQELSSFYTCKDRLDFSEKETENCWSLSL